jgi:LmbE family N-acetylglucosaminyl deacetylase
MARAADILAEFRRLPFADLDWITAGRSLLVLAPHPDDESLGCGGLIAEACASGQMLHVAILTDGTGSHPNSTTYPAARLKALRESEARAAMAELRLPQDRLAFLGLRDAAAPHAGPDFEAAVDRLADHMAQRGIGTICATWREDPHRDHVAAHLIAAAASRRSGARHLAYPVWGWTLPEEQELPEGPPAGVRLDITRHLDAKRRAIAAHRSQMGEVITDDPTAFRLPQDLLVNFVQPYEVFLQTD